MRNLIKICIILLGMSSLSSCVTGTPELAGLSPQAQAEIIKNYGGVYKIGKPYKIAGKWYYPKEDYSYSEVGTASWYGEDFNGKLTANGERYNMNTLTAAHRTLPLPSIVKVTNLQNGRALILRVNDRGPYVKNRIIDLSKRAAQLLGYIGQGTTKVRVEVLEEESRALKNALLNNSQQSNVLLADSTITDPNMIVMYDENGVQHYTYGMYHPTKIEAEQIVFGSAASKDGLTRKEGNLLDVKSVSDNAIYGKLADKVADGKKYYIQAGSFSQYELANALKKRLKNLENVHIEEAKVNGKNYYRVKCGPYSYVEEAKVANAKLKYNGVEDTKIEVK